MGIDVGKRVSAEHRYIYEPRVVPVYDDSMVIVHAVEVHRDRGEVGQRIGVVDIARRTMNKEH